MMAFLRQARGVGLCVDGGYQNPVKIKSTPIHSVGVRVPAQVLQGVDSSETEASQMLERAV